MNSPSPEFEAILATTKLEREKADGIKSLVASAKATAAWQARAEKAEAALARVVALTFDWNPTAGLIAADIRAAMKEPK